MKPYKKRNNSIKWDDLQKIEGGDHPTNIFSWYGKGCKLMKSGEIGE